MSTMVVERTVNLKEIGNKVQKGSNFVRTVLCRPEFNKYRLPKNTFKDCEGFWTSLSQIMYLKDSKAKRTLAKLYPCGL